MIFEHFSHKHKILVEHLVFATFMNQKCHFLLWNGYAPKFMLPPLKVLFSKCTGKNLTLPMQKSAVHVWLWGTAVGTSSISVYGSVLCPFKRPVLKECLYTAIVLLWPFCELHLILLPYIWRWEGWGSTHNGPKKLSTPMDHFGPSHRMK